MKESPIFQQIKGAGMTSSRPLVEAFTHWENLKRVLISLVWCDRRTGSGLVYRSVLCALLFADGLKGNRRSAEYIIAIALLFAMPLFVFMGALSDRIGRKWIMMLGCLLAAISYMPIYGAMQRAAGSNVVTTESKYDSVTGAISLDPQTEVNGKLQPAKEVLTYVDFGTLISSPALKLILLVFIQVFFVTMVYGPIAAYLVEAFPAKIRYTSLSLPYHIGNGVFGGLLPVIGLTVVAKHRQHLRGSLLPDRRREFDIHRGLVAAEGDEAHADLG
jgi:MFS family permease